MNKGSLLFALIALVACGGTAVIDGDDGTGRIMDMLLSKKRAADRKSWLEEKGDLASLEV